MFEIYFAGGESPSLRKQLLAAEVKTIAVSFFHLRSRLPQNRTGWVEGHFPSDVKVLLDSGGFSANQKPEKFSDGDWISYGEDYLDFIEANLSHISIVSEFDPIFLGREYVARNRDEYWDQIPPDKFLPIWHSDYGLSELDELASHYNRLGVDDQAPKNRLNGLVSRYGTKLHGISLTKPEWILDVRFATVSSTSWIAPTKYGETVVWDGHRLRRYPSEQKEQARKRHRRTFERAGFDADKMLADDPSEVGRFSIWSWVQFADSVRQRRGHRLTGTTDDPPSSTSPVTEGGSASNSPFAAVGLDTVDEGVPSRALAPLERPERSQLPVMGFESREVVTQKGTHRVSVPVLNQRALRQCDTCVLNERCPAMQPGHECAFEFPIEVRTRDQLMALLEAVIEMQTTRVAFARYAEELEGGSLDERTSVEIDRLMAVINRVKDIEDNREFFRVSVEARAEAGRLTRLFGSEAGAKLRELPEGGLDPEQTDRVLKDVLDVDVVGEE